MSVAALGPNSQAIVLLCSALGLPRDAGVKPLTPKEWDSLAVAIHGSELRTPHALLGLEAPEIARAVGVSPETALRIELLLARGGQLAMELERLSSRGIWLLTRADDDYPPLLRHRLKATAPPVLFGAGRASLLRGAAVAVVGSRDADEASVAFATKLAHRCADRGLTVVSGAARGIDTAAMLSAVDAGGTAVGVVADALERATRRQDLRPRLVEGELALITPQHPSAGFSVGVAMGRNRLIYCLADRAVVVASGASGGTRAGAFENLKAGWVPLFVRAEDNGPAGNTELLESGGLPITHDQLDDNDLFDRLPDRPTSNYQPTLEEASLEGD